MPPIAGPLEKQLVQVDLSKGMDESSAVQIQDPTMGFTLIENYIQDDKGAWDPRPGLVSTGVDEITATSIPGPRKSFKLQNGLGCYAANGRLYQFNEQTQNWRNKGQVSEWKVTGNLAGSSLGVNIAPFSTNENISNGYCLLDTKQTTKYQVIFYAAGLLVPLAGGTGVNFRMYLDFYDKASGNLVAQYEIPQTNTNEFISLQRFTAGRLCVVQDRYVFVLISGGDSQVTANRFPGYFKIDTAATLPEQLPAITYTTSTRRFITDAVPYLDRCYFSVVNTDDSSGSDPTKWGSEIDYVDVAGNFVTTDNYNDPPEPDGFIVTSIQVVAPHSDGDPVYVWWVGNRYDAGTGNPQTANMHAGIVDGTLSNNVALYLVDSGISVAGDMRYSGAPAMAISTDGLTIRVVCESKLAIPFSSFDVLNGTYSYGTLVASFTYAGKVCGWNYASTPFYSDASDRFYVQAAYSGKTDIVGVTPPSLGPSQVIDITSVASLSYKPNPFMGGYARKFRPAASVENFFAMSSGRYGAPQCSNMESGLGGSYLPISQCYRPNDLSGSGETFSVGTPYQRDSQSCSAAIYLLEYNKSSCQQAQIGSDDFISQGVPQRYDGGTPAEFGFVDYPTVSAGTLTPQDVATKLDAGNYSFVAVHKLVDRQGNEMYSRCSNVYTAEAVDSGTPGVYSIEIAITSPTVTWGDANGVPDAYYATMNIYRDIRVITELYATLEPDTKELYLVGTSASLTGVESRSAYVPSAGQGGVGVNQLSFDDDSQVYSFTFNRNNRSDSGTTADFIAVAKPLFRQPLLRSPILDRYPPQPTDTVRRHKDRLWTIDGLGRYLCYSDFFVDGEVTWWNPGFTIFCHGGSGRLTGMASMDGRLVAFKKDAIFVIDGDGPPENGGDGGEFTPPQIVAGEFGCINAKSIVETPVGVMYQSSRGIEILTRSMQVQFAGERVWRSVEDYPYCLGAAMNIHDGRVNFLMATAETGGTAIVLVYDTLVDAWSRKAYWADTGVYGQSPYGLCSARVNGKERTVITFGNYSVGYEDADTGLDWGTYYVPNTMETSWFHLGGPTGRERIYGFMAIFQKYDNHAVKISSAVNYASSYAQDNTWETATINALTVEEFEYATDNPTAYAVRFKIGQQEPAVTDPVVDVGEGRGARIFGVSYEVGPKPGKQRLPDAARG